MARPLRLERPGAWYHVTARGNARQTIFWDDRDRRHFAELLAEAVERFVLVLHAYVLMDNHYHLVVETPQAGLGGYCSGSMSATVCGSTGGMAAWDIYFKAVTRPSSSSRRAGR